MGLIPAGTPTPCERGTNGAAHEVGKWVNYSRPADGRIVRRPSGRAEVRPCAAAPRPAARSEWRDGGVSHEDPLPGSVVGDPLRHRRLGHWALAGVLDNPSPAGVVVWKWRARHL